MSACNCMGGPNCCKHQPRIGEYCRDMPFNWGDPIWIDPDFIQPTQQPPFPNPSASAWQCPGCGTYYAYWIGYCACQVRVTTSGTTTGIVIR